MNTNYYTILGIEKSASEKEIKTAFRKLAHKYHPDKGGDEKKFKEINEAYQTLSNKEKRVKYDRFGQSSANFGGASEFGNSGFGQYGFNMNYGDFAKSSNGAQFKVPSFSRVPAWVWIFLLPIIIVVSIIGLFFVFLWISFFTLRTVKR
ncbi:MAG TPA: J domain-containing protein [Candidatus Pacebacteria bacterium]|nr:J domain-containing protein [Candidatus Paceibacterota bacterium]